MCVHGRRSTVRFLSGQHYKAAVADTRTQVGLVRLDELSAEQMPRQVNRDVGSVWQLYPGCFYLGFGALRRVSIDITRFKRCRQKGPDGEPISMFKTARQGDDVNFADFARILSSHTPCALRYQFSNVRRAY